MRRLLLALAFLAGGIASANAVCPATSAVMKDNAGSTFNMGQVSDSNGNCTSKVDVDTASQLHNDITAPPTLGSASGGLTPKTLVGLTNTAGGTAVKASAGQVYKGQCYNPDASNSAVLEFFNTASVTLGTTAVFDFVEIGPGSNAGFTLSLVGVQYSTAITVAAVKTIGSATAPTTAIDCTVYYN